MEVHRTRYARFRALRPFCHLLFAATVAQKIRKHGTLCTCTPCMKWLHHAATLCDGRMLPRVPGHLIAASM